MMPFEKITICLEEIMKRFNIRDINLTSNQLRKNCKWWPLHLS